MDTAPGTRGIVIGDRYRVAGSLRRTGLIDAVDLEADRTEAACRVVGVPGDAERVDAWEDAWRAAQDGARLPRLRELVTDDDDAHWAILGPSPAAGRSLPDDAQDQARAIGEALAEAGLDVDDVTRAMLVAADDGRLCLDGVVWLGGDHAPRAAGRALAGLLPRADVDDDVASAAWAPPPRRAARPRPRRSRVLVPAAIVALLAAAGLVLFMPARSAGTAVLAPGASVGGNDVILGSAAYPLVSADDGDGFATPRSASVEETISTTAQVVATGPAEPEQPPPATVTVLVPVAADPATVPLPESVAPVLPAAGAQRVPELPVADVAPVLPLAASG
ncbi:MAG: hypothetical protein WCN97_08615 [Thermoleophilia bacterium]